MVQGPPAWWFRFLFNKPPSAPIQEKELTPSVSLYGAKLHIKSCVPCGEKKKKITVVYFIFTTGDTEVHRDLILTLTLGLPLIKKIKVRFRGQAKEFFLTQRSLCKWVWA